MCVLGSLVEIHSFAVSDPVVSLQEAMLQAVPPQNSGKIFARANSTFNLPRKLDGVSFQSAIAKFHNGYAVVMCYLKELISTLRLLGEWFRSTGPVRSHHHTLLKGNSLRASASHPP